MSETNNVQKVNVPESNVYLNDVTGDGIFKPCNCVAGKVDKQCDYYTVDDKPVCPDNKSVTKALAKIGIADLFGNKVDILGDVLPLCNTLKHDQDKITRSDAAWDLAKIGDKSAVPALLNALKNDKEVCVRATAAGALGKIGDKSAVPGLLNAFKNDKDCGVRSEAVWALGKIGDKSVVPALLKVLENDQEKYVRRAVLDALEKMGVINID